MIRNWCEEAQKFTGWSAQKTLSILEVSCRSYYRYLRSQELGIPKDNRQHRHPNQILHKEREAVIRYAREHPDIRHRALAYAMIDDDVAFLSPSTVYRILREADLVCRWKPKKNRASRVRYKGEAPDEKWQSDIRYVKLSKRNYYLINFIDEYSRFLVHHELMPSMDGDSVSWAAAEAFAKLPPGKKPNVQTDNGSGYISYEFKLVLSDKGLGHSRIKPHCPEENGIVERCNRTLGERIDELELADFQEAKSQIERIIHWYNNERLHSGIDFLTPWEWYRGNPKQRLEERQLKLVKARLRRREENLQIRQRALVSGDSFPEEFIQKELPEC